MAIIPVEPRDKLDHLDYLQRAGFANINATMVGGTMTLQSHRSERPIRSAFSLPRSTSPKFGADADADSNDKVDNNIMVFVPVRITHSGINISDHKTIHFLSAVSSATYRIRVCCVDDIVRLYACDLSCTASGAKVILKFHSETIKSQFGEKN